MKILSTKKIFIFVLSLKVVAGILFILLGGTLGYQATDADLYHAIVQGAATRPHAWGAFLSRLNDVGLYSRQNLSIIIFLISCSLLPWLFAKIVAPSSQDLTKEDWCALLILILYPTLFIYATDIYRDIPMVILFLVCLYISQYCMMAGSEMWKKPRLWMLFAIGLLCGYALFRLRFYLAAALAMSLVSSFLFDLSKRMWLYIVLYFLVLYVADLVGVFDWMKIGYRLTYSGAGSSYGTDFSQGLFLVNFVKSFLFSIYGLYFSGPLSVVFFIIESIPALLLSAYVIYYRKYANQFIGFLVFFFFIYSGIWTIGVDALGTAVRYRIFSYLAIFIAAYLMYQRKKIFFMSEVSND